MTTNFPDSPAPLFDWHFCSRPRPDASRSEDAYGVDLELGCFLVADGMGGRPEGDLASRIAVAAFLEYLRGLNRRRLSVSKLDGAVTAANLAVRRFSRGAPLRKGMGTTLSAVVVVGSTLWVAHVGDSRVYLYRKGRVEQLTQDHTLVQELVGREVIRPEVAGQHPLRHVLSRTIGTQSSVVPEVRQLTLLPGEGLILATDGFYRVMAGEELAQIAKNRWRHGARSVCEALAKCARKREAGDDLTLVVVKRLAKPGMTTATL